MMLWSARCNRCGLGNSLSWHHTEYVYQLHDLELPLFRDMGFCLDCNVIGPYREVLDISEQELQDWLTHDHPDDPELVLLKLAAWRDVLSVRCQDACCLCCGSRRILPFPSPPDIGQAEVAYSSGFIHPGCGGEFMFSGKDVIHILWHRLKRFYTLEGAFIREERV